ncbi:hypothetical protein H4F99_04415 [Lysobacter sp. SG-8]|uniref:RNA polymerase sigma factor 70 region 4 type 2 domain-containing protein n=1 Tax=Marilutibacter penaei TaxID=2759900 RepID=A0A7W3U2F8_9GAMM|nr:hypothetical protein [Lysobacter penaei]MBB1087728.1 hypothetical protein [Lysobacter penaei]
MSPPRPSPPSAALTAFMRGVERRAAVLAELQAGDAAAGDAAVEAALFAFPQQADTLPMRAWPVRFWALLLTAPALQKRVAVAVPLDATDRLAELGAGPRAAVLLQLAAGLDEAEAAEVMGISVAGYRLALAQAVTEDGAALSQQQAWQRLREQVHMRVRLLPPPRMQRLARVREAALHGETPQLPAGAPSGDAVPAGPRPHRRLRGVLWGLLVLCVLAFAATFWWPFPGFDPLGLSQASRAGAAPADGRVEVEALAAAAPAATHYDAANALLLHPDFEQLAHPAQAAVAEDLAFYSWLVARDAAPADPMLPPLAPVAEQESLDDVTDGSDGSESDASAL